MLCEIKNCLCLCVPDMSLTWNELAKFNENDGIASLISKQNKRRPCRPSIVETMEKIKLTNAQQH